MDRRLAIPVTAQTLEEAVRDIYKIAEISKDKRALDLGLQIIAELRLDYMSAPSLDRALEVLLKTQTALPKIVTIRHQSEAGQDTKAGFKDSEKERVRLLKRAVDIGTKYIDIELEHFHRFNRKSTQLIVSNHNFNRAYSDNELSELYRRIVATKSDIVKIAMKAESLEDSFRMLDFVVGADKPVTGICMGNLGAVTRIFGVATGSYLTFASLPDKNSAPGQLNIDEFLKILGWAEFDTLKERIQFREKTHNRYFQVNKIEVENGYRQFYVVLGPSAESPIHNHIEDGITEETHKLLYGSGKFIVYDSEGNPQKEIISERGRFHEIFSAKDNRPKHKYIAGPNGSIMLAREKYAD